MTITFIYNDPQIFAAYKPSGLNTVQLPSGGGSSLADELLRLQPELGTVAPSPGDAGLIHRLDRETSGIVLGARSPEVWRLLFDALLVGEIHKSYVALVEGEVQSETTFSSFIGSPHRGAKKVKIYEREPSPRARALLGTTTIRPLKYSSHRNITLIEADASPARRHQIRAHASHLGYPLVGDVLYGSHSTLGALCSHPREFFLHACKLSLQHPTTKRELALVSDYAPEIASDF